ncbi:MAG TPA: hypothetical protein GYA08_10865 [Chloroflexi bacterium]|nr:hypothetical protein [Chloroflexota bacterium]
MSEAFWWYVLAGFLLGFSVSTLWEWIYFRRRRMTIRNRHIAELEATVRAYTAAARAPGEESAADDWAEPTFHSPGVYLETEETPSAPPPAQASPPPQTMPPVNPSPAAATAVTTSILNSVQAATSQPANATPAVPTTHATTATVGFQSLSVPQPLPAAHTVTRQDAASPDDARRVEDAAAVTGAVAVMPRLDENATKAATKADAASSVETRTAAPAPIYVNGGKSTPLPAPVQGNEAGAGPGSRVITSTEIGVIVSSINELIGAVSPEPKETPAVVTPTETPTVPDASADFYVTRINGRTEYVLVRIVQSFVHFIRQLREIFTGAEAPRPQVHPAPPAPPGDDLTRIAGLGAEQAARLRMAGVTTYARLAELSPDELRMITLTPDNAAFDPGAWQAQARQLHGMQPEGGRA